MKPLFTCQMRPWKELLRIEPHGLVPVTEIDVRALSEIYEETDVYLSVYLPTASREEEAMNETYVTGRERAISRALGGELLESFRRTFEMASEHISHSPIHGEKGRIIFACEPLGLLHVYRLGVAPERKMILDTSPFLLPLAKLRDDYADYAILLMDSKEAKLFSVRSNVLKVEGSDSISLMNKHKKGGMSQMRFNRLRRGAISNFISELVEDIKGLEEAPHLRGLVIAGPGEAKKQLLEELPPEIRHMVLGVEDVSIDTPLGDLLLIGERAALQDERSRERAGIKLLRSAIMRSEPSAYGAEQVRKALNEGRVNLLMILRDASIPGWICERCQNMKEKVAPPRNCPYCGGPTSPVDIVEELYELAQRTGADVEFVMDSDFLESLGGIAALLRY
ncbi:MAG: Vms1/Ankzf1 family peptidyl-tRNA hydrolase [Thermoplasmatota archaeon]